VPDQDEREGIEACHRACALFQATSTPDPAPDTGKDEQGAPWPLEAAVEDGQVKFDDKNPNWELVGKAFVLL